MHVKYKRNQWVDEFYLSLYKQGYEPSGGSFGDPIYLGDGVEIFPDFKTEAEAKKLNEEEFV